MGANAASVGRGGLCVGERGTRHAMSTLPLPPCARACADSGRSAGVAQDAQRRGEDVGAALV
eukprot:7378162-Prymnesium_polylepis.3